MAKSNHEGTKVKGEGIFKRVGNFLKTRSQEAQKATTLLFIMILLCIITGICGCYLYTPAKEIYYSETKFFEAARDVYDYDIDSKERIEQQKIADEAKLVYGKTMDKYREDTNGLIQVYRSIDSIFIKALIAIIIVLPFVAIAIMFIGSPINFIFALINILLVAPAKAVLYLFNSFRPEKAEREPKKRAKREKPSHMALEEAAN